MTLLPSNSSAKCFITKWKSKFDLLCISVGIALGIAYFKLQMLWAVSLCFPVKCNDLLLFENFYLQSYVYNKLSDPCIILQSFSYFETFWWLRKFSFHHKWNEAWLLVINWYIRVASWVAQRLKGTLMQIWKSPYIFVCI